MCREEMWKRLKAVVCFISLKEKRKEAISQHAVQTRRLLALMFTLQRWARAMPVLQLCSSCSAITNNKLLSWQQGHYIITIITHRKRARGSEAENNLQRQSYFCHDSQWSVDVYKCVFVSVGEGGGVFNAGCVQLQSKSCTCSLMRAWLCKPSSCLFHTGLILPFPETLCFPINTGP